MNLFCFQDIEVSFLGSCGLFVFLECCEDVNCGGSRGLVSLLQ